MVIVGDIRVTIQAKKVKEVLSGESSIRWELVDDVYGLLEGGVEEYIRDARDNGIRLRGKQFFGDESLNNKGTYTGFDIYP